MKPTEAKAVCDFPGCDIELPAATRILCPVHWSVIPRPVLRQAIDAAEGNDIETMKRVLLEAIIGLRFSNGTN